MFIRVLSLLPLNVYVVRYFPHEVSDLNLLLTFLTERDFTEVSWKTRYVCLLWLSLVVSIPFSLSKFAAGTQSSYANIEGIIRHWLASTGAERDASAILAAKYYNRTDVDGTRLSGLLEWAQVELATASGEAVYLVRQT